MYRRIFNIFCRTYNKFHICGGNFLRFFLETVLPFSVNEVLSLKSSTNLGKMKIDGIFFRLTESGDIHCTVEQSKKQNNWHMQVKRAHASTAHLEFGSITSKKIKVEFEILCRCTFFSVCSTSVLIQDFYSN